MNEIDYFEYIEKVKVYGSVLGLDSMKLLLNYLDNPQNNLNFVHIGGTNGKGSTAAFIASILGVSGYKVGRYISPSVIYYEEKIQITTRNSKREKATKTKFISTVDLCVYMNVVKEACERIVENGYPHPTLFEIETALSFLYFKEMKCDVVVLEVGLGGRLDATNVVERVLCSVLTSISMDHMEYLGDTLERIAYEKAGIIKQNIPVISYGQVPEVQNVLKKVAKNQGSKYIEVDNSRIELIKTDLYGSVYSYASRINCHIQLLGLHQIKNSILSVLVTEELIEQGYNITDDDIKLGLKEATWRGRFEVVEKEPCFIIDGAHNEDAAIVLAENIKEYCYNRRIIFIMGVLKDKDYKQLIHHTARFASDIITITPNNSRGLDGNILATELIGHCKNIYEANTVYDAYVLAHKLAGIEDVIIAFGSLSYLHELYQLLT